MRVRVQRKLAMCGAVTTVGVGLVAHGMIVDHTANYRVGLVLVLAGLAGVLDARNTRNTQELMAHQEIMARLTMSERQQYAEMGWKAARLDDLSDAPGGAGDAQIVRLPAARRVPQVRKNGSA